MEVAQVQAGRATTQAVASAVDAAKADDSLAPVTVVVPSNTAGLSLRRLLGSGQLEQQPRLGPAGIANVAFATPFQLAGRVAAPVLAASGARPLTTAVLAASVRHVLRQRPGRFGAVADHLATETALVRAYGELTELEPTQLERLAVHGSERTRGLLALVRAVRRHLEDETDHLYHDEYAVMHEAADQLSAGHWAQGHVVLVGPFGQGPATVAFLSALARSAPASAVVALTGDPTVDADSVAQMARISGLPLAPARAARPVPTALVPAADPDEEVRAVVTEVLALAEAGNRFDRMAVFHPVADPYARTLREQFELAAIPTAGAEYRRLADSMTGRLVGRLLDLARGSDDATHRFDRAAVMALIDAAPLRGADRRPIRAGRWEITSRRAGVVGGVDDWQSKLAAYAAECRADADGPLALERSAGWADARRREADTADELCEFVVWLHERTAGAAIGSSWRARADWLRVLLDDLLPPVNRRHRWPEVEADAAERIGAVLQRVSVLDEVDPDAHWGSFVHALELELDAPMGRRGRIGSGVLIAPLATAAGLDLDHVFVVGLSEGVCPRSIREDTLLPDAERALVTHGLPLRTDRIVEERRRFLFAAAAGRSTRTYLMPMGDHRNGRTRTASRWWVEAVNALDGSIRSSDDWMHADVPELRPPSSFVQALDHRAARGVATSIGDIDLQFVRSSRDDATEPELRRRRADLAQRRRGFNRFTGDLTGEDLPEIGGEVPVSATRLESWAKCPRRYLFAQLLQLDQIDAPDLIEEITALDRGSLLHEVLERFIADVVPEGPLGPIEPGVPWTDADRDRLFATAAEVFADYEARGKTGRPLLWGIQRELIESELDRFLVEDTKLRAELGSRPEQVEMAIGFSPEPGAAAAPAAPVELGDGRVVHLRGYADRVDLRRDGSPVVLDYKTGKSETKKRFEEDPVVGGTKLQLGVYAEAARQRYGTDRAAAHYWFTSDRGDFSRVGYDWDTERRTRFVEALTTIVAGIEGGVFPPNPGDYDDYFGTFVNCRYCEFDDVCDRDRGAEFERAAESGRIDAFLALDRSREADR